MTKDERAALERAIDKAADRLMERLEAWFAERDRRQQSGKAVR